jgi:hypothetical protein
VIFVDEMENKDLQQEEIVTEEPPKYVPRPAWQVWGARVALVLFIALIIMYMIKIARGGL